MWEFEPEAPAEAVAQGLGPGAEGLRLGLREEALSVAEGKGLRLGPHLEGTEL